MAAEGPKKLPNSAKGEASMKRERGRLIVFEGVDAAGKTSLCKALFDVLSRDQVPVEIFSFPGKQLGTLGELVYRIHHRHESDFGVPNIDPCALQALHIAAHIDLIKVSIKKEVDDGKWVLLDRFWWSTYVYGLDGGVQEKALQLMIDLEKLAWGSMQPDIVFLIDSPVPLRGDENHNVAWKRKRELYLGLVKTETSSYRCKRIETAPSREAKNSALKKITKEVDTLQFPRHVWGKT